MISVLGFASLILIVGLIINKKINTKTITDLTSITDTTTANFADTQYYLQKKQEIANQLKTTPPESIYTQILEEYKDKTSQEQHRISHIFGKQLYLEKGNTAITVCDSSFAFGCFHGFFNEAIKTEGIETALKLDKTCIERFGQSALACQHGLGHGLLEYFTPKKLPQALYICGEMQWQKPLQGCSGGVFMEYNLPSIDDKIPGSRAPIPFNSNDPYRPCTSIPERFQPECYYYLGMYWNQVFSSNSTQMLQLCEQVANARLKDACLLGVGNTLSESSHQNIYYVKSACNQITDNYAKSVCLAGGAWLFFAKKETRSQYPQLCEDLSLEYKNICLNKVNLADFK